MTPEQTEELRADMAAYNLTVNLLQEDRENYRHAWESKVTEVLRLTDEVSRLRYIAKLAGDALVLLKAAALGDTDTAMTLADELRAHTGMTGRMMKLEAGKYYRTRDGRKVGPMIEWNPGGRRPWSDPSGTDIWADNGNCDDPDLELIAEWTDIDLSNPLGIVFGLMPKETQEAMKAHGGPWEVFSYGGWGFWGGAQYEWSSDRAYRVKPEPKVETVVLTGGEANGWGFYADGGVSNAFSITFDLIDGKPDCASIKMEEL